MSRDLFVIRHRCLPPPSTALTTIGAASAAFAKLSQYLMDRDAAIALARSAAPEGISKDASVLVLTPKGWETAVKGTNGFVCMAGPAWTASIDFYDVWSPKQRGAICLNTERRTKCESSLNVNRVGALAEEQGHHTDILLTWGKAEIKLWTHAVDGLTESDLILAAKIDELDKWWFPLRSWA